MTSRGGRRISTLSQCAAHVEHGRRAQGPDNASHRTFSGHKDTIIHGAATLKRTAASLASWMGVRVKHAAIRVAYEAVGVHLCPTDLRGARVLHRGAHENALLWCWSRPCGAGHAPIRHRPRLLRSSGVPWRPSRRPRCPLGGLGALQTGGVVYRMGRVASRVAAGRRFGNPISVCARAAPAQRLAHVPPAWPGRMRRGSTRGHGHTSVGLSADVIKL